MIRETQKLAKFVGLNNLLGARELEIYREGRPAGRFLRNAVNVDLTNDGNLKRRPGYERVKALSETTHIWSDGDVCYVTAGLALYGFDGVDTTSITTVQSAEPSFCRTPLGVVVGDGYSLRLLSGTSASYLALPRPEPVPSVTAGSGSLPAGRYLVTFAHASSSLSSGCTTPQEVTLTAPGGLSIALVASSYDTLVYVSSRDGEVPYRRFTIPAGGTSASYTNEAASYEPATTLFQTLMPPGDYMTMHGSQLWSSSSNILYYSEPFKYGLRKMTGYIILPDAVTALASLGPYLFVGTSKEVIRLEGPLAEAMSYETMASYGVIPGSLEVVPDGTQAFMALSGGYVASVRNNGELRLLDEAVKLPEAASAVSTVVERDGMEQFRLQLQRPESSNAFATSYIEAEVTRRGNLVNQELSGG